MTRTLALAALGVGIAATLLPATSASACQPLLSPQCTPNACLIAGNTYTTVRNTAGRGPTWQNLDLGVCGT